MRGYSLLIASDVSSRDGLGVELYDRHGTLLAEVFRDDSAGSKEFNAFSRVSVPLDVIAWFLERASTL